MAAGLELIDWQRPWLQGWRAQGETRCERVLAAGISVVDALNEGPGCPVQFVAQGDLPAGVAYESFIHDQRRCPTREGLHDFFNGLAWHIFPDTKSTLNRLQQAEIRERGIQAARGPVRDAITVFDENGICLQAPDALWAALAERRWASLFGELRPLWPAARMWVFGHALLEKLVHPYKSITGHVLRVDDGVDGAAIDGWLAAHLTADRLAGKPFVPLPVLGVPGWWPPNGDPHFYADDDVFRPRRKNAPPEKTAAGLCLPAAKPLN